MSAKRRVNETNMSPSDAFALMMQRQGKRQASHATTTVPSSFVLCPAGCGKSFLGRDINVHLDECLDAVPTECKGIAKLSSDTTSETEIDSQASPKTSLKAPDVSCVSVSPSNANDEENENVNDKNAFVHLLQNSARHSRKSVKMSGCRFHLHSNGGLAWENSDSTARHSSTDLQWSTSVSVKQIVDGSVTDARRDWIVSTAIPSLSPSTTSPIPRLVRRHSRLSVPVLKSILQKAIRRRRPLPAAKVAMELADKSLGDLLRRLPIIILEDSFMHPDLPLLCWLMVAHSKDYIIPPQLIARVICIVFEVASCPWTDYLDANDDSSTFSELNPSTDHAISPPSPDCETVLRSIMLRASYGGMAGDIKMLIGYTNVWRNRFHGPLVPIDIVSALSTAHTASLADDSSNCMQFNWCQIPELIHRRAKQQSEIYVTPLVTRGIDQLIHSDICIEGVDFHCSSVLDHVLSGDALIDTLYSHLITTEGLKPPAAILSHRSWLQDILKNCMWKYSSGVNLRRPLRSGKLQAPSTESADQLKSFWKDEIAPKARDYMDKYIRDRLAKV